MGLSVRHSIRYENVAGNSMTVIIDDTGKMTLTVTSAHEIVMQKDELKRWMNELGTALASSHYTEMQNRVPPTPPGLQVGSIKA